MSPDTRQLLEAQLTRHEGRRSRPYVDTVGKITIGIGRNLSDVGLSKDEQDYLFNNDLDRAITQCMGYSWYSYLGEVRQAAIVNMMFNMGAAKFAGFKKFMTALEREDWFEAAQEMLMSDWAKQVGSRAIELSDIVKFGAWTEPR